MTADKAFVTPPFQIRQMQENEKLQGHKNVKTWKKMVELDLRALNLQVFITSKCGVEVPLLPSKCATLDAQTLQYIKSSVIKSIVSRLREVYTAYDAYQYLLETFGNNRTHDIAQLYDQFVRLRFHQGFDPQRFIADFDDLIN